MAGLEVWEERAREEGGGLLRGSVAEGEVIEQGDLRPGSGWLEGGGSWGFEGEFVWLGGHRFEEEASGRKGVWWC